MKEEFFLSKGYDNFKLLTQDNIVHATKLGHPYQIISYECNLTGDSLTQSTEDFSYLQLLEKISDTFVKPLELIINVENKKAFVSHVFELNEDEFPKDLESIMESSIASLEFISRPGLVFNPSMTTYSLKDNKLHICLIRNPKISLTQSWALAIGRLCAKISIKEYNDDIITVNFEKIMENVILSRIKNDDIKSLFKKLINEKGKTNFPIWIKEELKDLKSAKTKIINEFVKNTIYRNNMPIFEDDSRYLKRSDLFTKNNIEEVLDGIDKLRAEPINGIDTLLGYHSTSRYLTSINIGICYFYLENIFSGKEIFKTILAHRITLFELTNCNLKGCSEDIIKLIETNPIISFALSNLANKNRIMSNHLRDHWKYIK